MKAHPAIRRSAAFAVAFALLGTALDVRPAPARTAKPPLHARHWLAVTGKPLAATAGSSPRHM